jgi:hypothetical protein
MSTGEFQFPAATPCSFRETFADPTLHAAKRAKQAGAKVIFNAAPYRDWCKTMSHDVDVSDRSHENAALLKLFLIAPPPEKARDLFHSRERGLRAD